MGQLSSDQTPRFFSPGSWVLFSCSRQNLLEGSRFLGLTPSCCGPATFHPLSACSLRGLFSWAVCACSFSGVGDSAAARQTCYSSADAGSLAWPRPLGEAHMCASVWPACGKLIGGLLSPLPVPARPSEVTLSALRQ